MINDYIDVLQNALNIFKASNNSSKIYSDLSNELDEIVSKKVSTDVNLNDNFDEISGVLNEYQEKLIYYVSTLAKYNVSHPDSMIYLDDTQIEFLKKIIISLRRFVSDSSFHGRDISYFEELINSLASNEMFDNFELLQKSFKDLDTSVNAQKDIYFDLLKKNVLLAKKEESGTNRARNTVIN